MRGDLHAVAERFNQLVRDRGVKTGISDMSHATLGVAHSGPGLFLLRSSKSRELHKNTVRTVPL